MPDIQPKTPEELHEWSRRLVEDGRQMRRGLEAQWWENIATYTGDLWAEYNPHDRKLMEPPMPEHRVRLAINLAQPVVRTEYAKLLKNKPIVDCIARSPDKTDLNAAEMGDKLLNNYAEKTFGLPRIRRLAVIWAVLTGMGGVFVDYDPNCMGEVQVLADPAGNPIFDPEQIEQYKAQAQEMNNVSVPQGELDISAFGPFEFIRDFATTEIEKAKWVIVTKAWDVLEAQRRWGVDLDGCKRVKANVLEQRLLARSDLTSTLSYGESNAQHLVEIHRLFIRPGHFLFPKGAEIVFTEEQIVTATEFPFQHGQLPVATMGHIPNPASSSSMSVLPQIHGPTLELSRTESQLVENRNTMGNPPWIEYDIHGLSDDAIQNKPGLRIQIPWRPNVPEPHPVEMPEMPVYVQNLIETLKEHILEISGQGETSQGRVPPGARSGVAIAYLQEEDDTKLGPTVTELEEMAERYSWQILAVMAEKYDTPRTVRIARKHSEPEVFDFMGTMLLGVAGVVVQAGSALPRSKAAKQQFMFDLYDRGLITDPRELKQMLELGEGEPDEWEYDLQQAERENKRMMAGEMPGVEEWYNHQAHHTIHRRFMKSADYESMQKDDPQRAQLFMDHDQLHTQLEASAMIEQAKMAMMTGGAPPPEGGAPPGMPGPNLANGTNNQAPAGGPPPSPNGTGGPLAQQPQ